MTQQVTHKLNKAADSMFVTIKTINFLSPASVSHRGDDICAWFLRSMLWCPWPSNSLLGSRAYHPEVLLTAKGSQLHPLPEICLQQIESTWPASAWEVMHPSPTKQKQKQNRSNPQSVPDWFRVEKAWPCHRGALHAPELPAGYRWGKISAESSSLIGFIPPYPVALTSLQVFLLRALPQ